MAVFTDPLYSSARPQGIWHGRLRYSGTEARRHIPVRPAPAQSDDFYGHNWRRGQRLARELRSMPLTLEVVGQKASQMGGATRKVFQAGGTIGRLRDNDWVLPDDYISGHHAKIIFSNGSFLIEDTSTNGVFVNSPQNRLTKGQPYTLRHGDTVFIDDYEVRVSVSAEPAAAPPSARRPAPIPEDPFFQSAPGAVGALDEMDPLKLLGIQDARAVPPGPSAA